jgi:hypothetical protein
MARKPRRDFSGGFYHVLACGNRRTTIFHDDADSRAYLERLERDPLMVSRLTALKGQVRRILGSRNSE